jgi:hypothetical protein
LEKISIINVGHLTQRGITNGAALVLNLKYIIMYNVFLILGIDNIEAFEVGDFGNVYGMKTRSFRSAGEQLAFMNGVDIGTDGIIDYRFISESDFLHILTNQIKTN